jgi:zinc/manganese transport system ATP-binding protein
MTAAASAISLRGAEVMIGGRTVWRAVDLEVAPGEFVAVLGPNGVGKSTLLKAILGLLPASSGQIEVLGRPAGEAGHDIGYLPQRRSFDPALRIRGVDIVRLGLDGDRWGVPVPWRTRARRDMQQRVHELIDLVGASEYAGRPVGECSGGEQQRLLIAQALARRPSLLLLDEPLDSLDLPNQAGVAALIESICRQQGVTVLVVAHDVNPILGFLDRVVYFAGGGAAVGAPHDVITTETLSRLYGTPIEVLKASDGRLVVVGHPEAATFHPEHHGHGHAH